MSAKIINTLLAVLLALVMTFNATAVLVPTATQAANSPATLAMEHSTTGS